MSNILECLKLVAQRSRGQEFTVEHVMVLRTPMRAFSVI